MLTSRQILLLSERVKYKRKRIEKFKDTSLMYSFSPEESSDSWNTWSPLPWEYDPYNYRNLRRSVAILIRRYKKGKTSLKKKKWPLAAVYAKNTGEDSYWEKDINWDFQRVMRNRAGHLAKKKMTRSKFCYMLDSFEEEWERDFFPFWHSNHILDYRHPFGC